MTALTPGAKAEYDRRRMQGLRDAARVIDPEIRTKRVVIAEFNYMLNQARVNDWSTNCEGREDEFVMYERTPTADVATALCEGCPMLALCLERATEAHVGWGVWGGVAFVDGKPYTRSRRQERMEAA